MIVAIDPGKNRCACACFSEGTSALVSAFFLTPGQEPPVPFSASVVVIEKPRITTNTPNWESIVDEAWSGAIIAGTFRAPIIPYYPNEWKATVKKPVHHRRLWRVLSPAERFLLPVGVAAVIDAAVKSYAATGKVTKYSHEWHNLLDAVGLGLFHLGRTGRGGATKI
jgi:hypothetical protein